MHENRRQGDLLMDAPAYSWSELVQLAADRAKWRRVVNALKVPSVNVLMGSHVQSSAEFPFTIS